MTMRKIKTNQKRYMKINRNHIFIQPNANMLDTILSIQNNNNHIHIFELCPPAVMNILERVCATVGDKNKVVIHISSFMKDYKKLIEDQLKDIHTNWSVICESKDVVFKFSKYNEFIVRFTEEYSCHRVTSYIHINEFHRAGIPKYFYNISGCEGSVIDTVPKRDKPELFKDLILKRFKQISPSGILKLFKNDDELWEFISTGDISTGGGE